MIYKMTVTIADPKTPAGMCSDLTMNLKCRFAYNPQQYGNGHYVSITQEGANKFFGVSYDLRYDKTFNRNRKEQWLEEWAKSYWSGKDGAYAVKTLKIGKEVAE